MRRTLALIALAALASTGCKKLFSKKKPELAAPLALTTTMDAASLNLKKGCDSNNMDDCTNLGLRYARGEGVPKDEPRAVALYEKACDQHNAAACSNLGLMYSQG